MKKPVCTVCTALLFSLLSATPACADWGNLWEETKKLEQDARKLGQQTRDFGVQAWQEAQRGWDALDINGSLQAAFGSDVNEQSALVGRFYDLKQPVDGKSRPLRRQQVVELFRQFDDKKWDSKLFEGYYSPKVKLYAPYFYLPRCKAEYGPEAFQCNEKEGKPRVRPSDWVVIYRGVVTAPESGTFRFAGMGDDVLMVRFNNKLVLESGWSIPTRGSMTLGTDKNYQQEISSRKGGRALYQYKTTPHWNRVLGGIPTGTPFKVQKGKKYPIEILVSEIPGNEFGFCLLLEELKHGKKAPYGTYEPNESPTLHLFRTNKSLPEPERIKKALTVGGKNYTVNGNMEGPTFRKDSLIWEVDFAEAEKRGLFDRLFGKITGSDKDTAMGTSTEDDEKEKTNAEEENKPAPDKRDKGSAMWDSLFR